MIKKALVFVAITGANALICTFVFGFVEGLGSQSWAIACVMGISFGAGGVWADIVHEWEVADGTRTEGRA
jgi:hypothetical protein